MPRRRIEYGGIAVVWAAAIAYSWREYHRDKATESVEAVEAELGHRAAGEATTA